VPALFEKLASQLHEPPFRTADRGYDPDDVQALLSVVAERLAVLEDRVATAEVRADRAEARLVRARRQATGQVLPAEELAEAIRAGEREADDVRAAGAGRSDAVRAAAKARVEAVRREAEMPELRARIEATRQEAAATVARRDRLGASLDAATSAVASSRRAILDGIGEVLEELKEAR
jgi:cell division septum initiation protein DivIVA